MVWVLVALVGGYVGGLLVGGVVGINRGYTAGRETTFRQVTSW